MALDFNDILLNQNREKLNQMYRVWDTLIVNYYQLSLLLQQPLEKFWSKRCSKTLVSYVRYFFRLVSL